KTSGYENPAVSTKYRAGHHIRSHCVDSRRLLRPPGNQSAQSRARRAPAAVDGETSFLPVDGHANDAKVTSLRPSSYDATAGQTRSEEHTSELQSRENLVCRLLLEKKKKR